MHTGNVFCHLFFTFLNLSTQRQSSSLLQSPSLAHKIANPLAHLRSRKPSWSVTSPLHIWYRKLQEGCERVRPKTSFNRIRENRMRNLRWRWNYSQTRWPIQIPFITYGSDIYLGREDDMEGNEVINRSGRAGKAWIWFWLRWKLPDVAWWFDFEGDLEVMMMKRKIIVMFMTKCDVIMVIKI